MIEKETVGKLSKLSMISVTESEAEAFAEDMSRVIGMLDKIREVEIHAPSSSSGYIKYPVLSEDVASDSEIAAEIKKGKKDSTFSVPRVI